MRVFFHIRRLIFAFRNTHLAFRQFSMSDHLRVADRPLSTVVLCSTRLARASLRKELHPGYEIPGLYEYRDITPLSWGERFHFKKLVCRPAMELINQRGGGL